MTTNTFSAIFKMSFPLFVGGLLVCASIGCTQSKPPTDEPIPADVTNDIDTTAANSEGNGVTERSHDPEKVMGTLWEWVAFVTPVEQIDVDSPENYTIELLPDGEINVKADCNVGGGSYTLEDDGHISIGTIGLTEMECPEGSLGQDFAMYLSEAVLFFVEGEGLYMDLPYDSGTMHFVRTDN